MTRARYGILAGVAGAAFGAWWWRRRRSIAQQMADESPQGEVIFSNAPLV